MCSVEFSLLPLEATDFWQDCGLGGEIGVTAFTLLDELGHDLEEHRQCLLFTFDNNNMNILAECCPTLYFAPPLTCK